MPKVKRMTYSAHRKNWQACDKCELCHSRRNIVLARGQLNPCHVLFIGEAPGTSEDMFGKPFTGPAGHLLDDMIEDAGFDSQGIRWAFTNLVACIPKESRSGRKVHEPHKEHIKACRQRLSEFLKLANPLGIVRVGTLATKHVDKSLLLESCVKLSGLFDITHPAAILRSGPHDTIMIKRCVVILQDVVRTVLQLKESQNAKKKG